MGGTISSTLGRGVTREQLLRSSEKPREFMNQIFNTMLTKLTPEDFLKLGKAQTCSSFVFMMADSLHQMFDDLRIRPTKAKDTGIVLFQKVSTLTAQTKESKELCLFIAYFYIRLFQIFGALAITITDDPGAGSVLAATRYGPPVQTEQRGFFAQQKRIPGSRGTYLGVGGAESKYFLTGKARVFAPIREVFEDGRIETTARGNPRLVLAFRDFPEVEIIPERVDESGRKDQNMKINLGDSSHLYGNMSMSSSSALAGMRKYKVTLSNFRLADASKRATMGYINRQISGYTKAFDITTLDGGQTWVSGNISFTDKLAESIRNIQDIIKRIDLNPSVTLKDLRAIPEQQRAPLGYGDAGAFRERERGREDYDAAAVRSRGLGGVGGRDIGVPTALQNNYLIDTLKGITGQKSVSFCVARALQLIDANSLFRLRSGEGVKSSVCTRFDAPTQSVPQPGQSLDKMPGLKALDQLYHTQPSITQDSVRVGVAVEASDEYAEFLKSMMSLFGRSGSTTQLSGVEKITVNTPDCGPQLVNKYLQVKDPKAIQGILAIVNQMFGRQLAHTKTVMKFFETRLFLIKTGPDRRISIDIHPKILQGGIDEIEKVSKEAREILVGYYTNCEKSYQEGMKLVLQARPIPIA